MRSNGSSRVDEMIDFDFAASVAAELLPGGPALSRRERRIHVDGLRQAAATATTHVQREARLDVSHVLDDTSVLVVDRPGWMRANLKSFRELLDVPITHALDAQTDRKVSTTSRHATATELGLMLAFLGTRVLGQYEPFAPDGGRLLLVAPTVASVAHQLDVDPEDFRLWVCLHEETHRVQFAAAPWLADHMRRRIDSLGGKMLSTQNATERLRQIFSKVPEVFGPGGSKQALDLVQTPETSAELDKLTAVMSLLEGHADVIMDQVGPEVIPTVDAIRAKFNERRSSHGIESLVRKFLGLEAKMRQYREGAAFVRGIVDEVGYEGFNRVWRSPDTLPEPAEITRPERWLARVQPQ